MGERNDEVSRLGFELPIQPRDGLFALALAAVVVVVFWPVFGTPYVADDWGQLYLFATELQSGGGLLTYLWHGTEDGVFYRPLAVAYIWASSKLFGLSSLGYHLAHTALHLGSSLIVAWVAGCLFGSRLLAWSVGTLYASAAVVLLQPLLWCVGAADLGGAFFALASIALYIGGRRWPSAVAFLVALGFKESLLAVPLVLIAVETCLRESGSATVPGLPWLRRMLRLWPYGVVVAFYLLASGHGSTAAFERPGSHPYLLIASGAHVPSHLLQYAGWAFDLVIPVELPGLPGGSWQRAVIAALVPLTCLGALGALVTGVVPRSRALRGHALLALWIAAMLLLPLMLPNHAYRYYGIHAVAPFLCGLARLSQLAGRWLLRAPQLRTASACGLVAASVLFSTMFVQASVEGRSGWPAVEASYLATRSRTVRMVVRDLLHAYPVLPENSTLVFAGVDTGSFGGERGVRLWYPESNAMVYRARDVMRGEQGLQLRERRHRGKGSGAHREPKLLDPRTTLFFRAREGHLVELEGAAIQAR